MNLESMSETLTPKKHGRLAFFWMILGALATLTVFPYLLAINPSLLEQVPLPFGAGHLPTAAAIWPLTPAVIIRTIGLNALAGIAFGLIYWRWGLEYAMLAHFCADLAIQSFGSG